MYRLARQTVLKHDMTGGCEKMHILASRGHAFHSKLVQAGPSAVYLVGGATDVKGACPVSTCSLLDFSVSPPGPQPKAKMHNSRLNFAACMSQNQKYLYVCGGYVDETKVT